MTRLRALARWLRECRLLHGRTPRVSGRYRATVARAFRMAHAEPAYVVPGEVLRMAAAVREATDGEIKEAFTEIVIDLTTPGGDR